MATRRALVLDGSVVRELPAGDDLAAATAVHVDGARQARLDVDPAPVTAADVGAQSADPDLTAIAALDASAVGLLGSAGAGWVRRTYAQVKAALSIAAADLTATGDRNATTYLRGDNTWAAPPAGAGGGGGGTGLTAGATVQAVKALAFDPATANGTFSLSNSTLAVKMAVAVPVSLTSIVLCRGDGKGAGLAGWYVAVYDGAGALLAQSADFASLIGGNDQPFAVPLITPAAVPASVFYVAIRFGSATSQPNFISPPVSQHWRMNAGLNLSYTTPDDPLSPRIATAGNSWSGASAPATLGGLQATYFYPWCAAR